MISRVEAKPRSATRRLALRWWPLLAILMQDWAWGFNDAWTTPHPWRRQALLEGRTFEHSGESFLQRFSYRSLSEEPATDEDGVRGSVGSLTSKRALSEIRFRKSFPFDQGGGAFMLAMQRGDDFDGSYDRQLVGFSQKLSENWRISARGDVQGDKAESDAYFQTRWQAGPGRLLEAAVILPDAYFNDKTPGSIEYEKRPWTFFARARMALSSRVTMATSVNHSPRAVVNDQLGTGLRAAGKSTRATGSVTWQSPQWRARLSARGEHTERDFVFSDGDREQFRRISHEVGFTLTRTAHQLDPTLGLQHFYLDEEGFFGAATNTRGQLHRNEPLVHGSVRLDTGERHNLRPELLISRPDFQQTVSSDRWRDRDVRGWLAKINLPWRYEVNRENGAILTIAASMELHDPGFGGGNVQLHWPL